MQHITVQLLIVSSQETVFTCIDMYCSNGTLGIDSKLKTSRLQLHVRSGPVLAKRLALFSSTWWCSVGQPVSWALWEPAWLAAFAASAAKPSLMTRR